MLREIPNDCWIAFCSYLPPRLISSFPGQLVFPTFSTVGCLCSQRQPLVGAHMSTPADNNIMWCHMYDNWRDLYHMCCDRMKRRWNRSRPVPPNLIPWHLCLRGWRMVRPLPALVPRGYCKLRSPATSTYRFDEHLRVHLPNLLLVRVARSTHRIKKEKNSSSLPFCFWFFSHFTLHDRCR